MHVITAVDDSYGLMFNNRRQSRDSELISRIINNLGSKLYISEYSKPLFQEYASSVIVCKPTEVPDDAAYFLESPEILSNSKIETITLYHWNRIYPADVFFPKEILNDYKLDKITEFKGNSHDNITEEVWRKK